MLAIASVDEFNNSGLLKYALVRDLPDPFQADEISILIERPSPHAGTTRITPPPHLGPFEQVAHRVENSPCRHTLPGNLLGVPVFPVIAQPGPGRIRADDQPKQTFRVIREAVRVPRSIGHRSKPTLGVVGAALDQAEQVEFSQDRTGQGATPILGRHRVLGLDHVARWKIDTNDVVVFVEPARCGAIGAHLSRRPSPGPGHLRDIAHCFFDLPGPGSSRIVAGGNFFHRRVDLSIDTGVFGELARDGSATYNSSTGKVLALSSSK